MRRILLALALLIPALAWAVACPSGAAKTYAIIVPHQNVPSNQTNFIIPFCSNGFCTSSTTLPTLKNVANSGLVNNTAANTSGVTGAADVWFCDAYSGGNLIKFENSYYDGTTGKGLWWYQKTLSSTVDNYVYLNVGKASQATSLQDLSMWNDVGYLWVIHGSNPSSVVRAESVGFLGASSTNGTVTATTGPLGGAFSFAGGGSLQFTHSNSIDTSGAWSYESWIKPSATATQIIQVQGTSNGCSTPSFLTALVISNNLQTDACYSGADHGVISSASIGTGTWHYTASGTDNTTFRTYIDGAADSATAGFSGPYPTTTSDLYLGANSALGQAYSGQMFELRKANTMFSADWYKTNYYAMTSPGGFNVVVDMSSPTGLTAGANCIQLNIQNTYVPNTDRTNYLLNVFGMYPWMADITNGGYAVNGNSGHDIRFFSNNTCTSALSFQRVFWVNTTGLSKFIVLVPSVSHTTTTPVYIKIGSPSDTTDASVNLGTFASSWINAMLWGDTSTLGLTSSGADGVTFTQGGTTSAAASIGPMGPVMYLPSGTNFVEFVPPTPYLLSTYGYPTDNTVSTVVTYIKATPGTAAQANANAGINFGGYGCYLHSGGCVNPAADGARSFYFQPPNSGTSCGFSTGDSVSGGQQIYSACGTMLSSFGWHRLTQVYTPAGAQMNAATVLQIIDGVVQSPSYTSGTTVLHTTDGGTFSSSEVSWGRSPAHSFGPLSGYIGPSFVYAGALTADDDATYFNNDMTPYLFYSFGASSPVSAGYVKHKIVRH